MKPITVITGTAVPLDRSDVDTDQIIPSDWLKRVARTGFGEGLFSEWREDPEFVLNLPQFGGANILVAGPDFGTGSSREHAVWALTDYGFEAVVAPRFGDIFRNNSTKAGLVPCAINSSDAQRLLEAVEADPQLKVTVDIERRVVAAPEIDLETSFPLDDFTRYRLMNGLDDIGLTLLQDEAIANYEAERPTWLPATSVESRKPSD